MIRVSPQPLNGADVPQDVRHFWKVHETKQIGQAVGMPPITPRKRAIRHYMISRILLGGLTMNDKRHVSIGDAPGPTVTEMIRGMSDRTL